MMRSSLKLKRRAASVLECPLHTVSAAVFVIDFPEIAVDVKFRLERVVFDCKYKRKKESLFIIIFTKEK